MLYSDRRVAEVEAWHGLMGANCVRQVNGTGRLIAIKVAAILTPGIEVGRRWCCSGMWDVEEERVVLRRCRRQVLTSWIC